MHNPQALGIAQAALSLTRTHPHARAIDVLDLVMRGQIDQALDFANFAAPAAPFGQLVAAAFDDAMTPVEWKAFTGATADAQLRQGCLELWRTYVMPQFEARYCVVVRGLA